MCWFAGFPQIISGRLLILILSLVSKKMKIILEDYRQSIM